MLTETTAQLNVASEFSPTPGPRFKSEGKLSGEEFRETILKQRFQQAREENVNLLIDLDGGYGYAPSFLEEAFGGLAREYGVGPVRSVLRFKSDEEPYLIQDVLRYIEKAEG